MHPRYISTSFVSFPFLFSLFSILPPLFLSYLPSQRQLSRDTSRVARTHTRTRCRFTLGDPCRTNERTHTRLGETATYTRGMCLEGTVVANYFVSPCLLDSEQLQLDSNACKEILDDDNSSSKIPYRFRRKEKFNPPPSPPLHLGRYAKRWRKNGFILAPPWVSALFPRNTRQSIREHYLRA